MVCYLFFLFNHTFVEQKQRPRAFGDWYYQQKMTFDARVNRRGTRGPSGHAESGSGKDQQPRGQEQPRSRDPARPPPQTRAEPL